MVTEPRRVRRVAWGRRTTVIGLTLVALTATGLVGYWLTSTSTLRVVAAVGSVMVVLLVVLRPHWGLYVMLALIPLEGVKHDSHLEESGLVRCEACSGVAVAPEGPLVYMTVFGPRPWEAPVFEKQDLLRCQFHEPLYSVLVS